MNTHSPLRILGIAGSLRTGSYNRALLNASKDLLADAALLDIHPLDDIPLYNGDVEKQGFPGPVQALKQAIAEADALLIATPEYNYSIPGVLKNAIDWVSRPPDKTPLHGKPTGVIGASIGQMGTARAQLALRQSFVFTDTPAMRKPEVMVPAAQKKFDDSGKLTDADTRKFLDDYLQAFVAWIRTGDR